MSQSIYQNLSNGSNISVIIDNGSVTITTCDVKNGSIVCEFPETIKKNINLYVASCTKNNNCKSDIEIKAENFVFKECSSIFQKELAYCEQQASATTKSAEESSNGEVYGESYYDEQLEICISSKADEMIKSCASTITTYFKNKYTNTNKIVSSVKSLNEVRTSFKYEKGSLTTYGAILCLESNTNSCIQYSDNQLTLGLPSDSIVFGPDFISNSNQVKLVDGFNSKLGLSINCDGISNVPPCIGTQISTFSYSDEYLSYKIYDTFLEETVTNFVSAPTQSSGILPSVLPITKWSFQPVPQSLCIDFELFSGDLNNCIQDYFRSSSNTPIGPVFLTNCVAGGQTKTVSLSTPAQYSYAFPALGLTNITGYSTNCTTIPCTYTPTMTTDSLTVCSVEYGTTVVTNTKELEETEGNVIETTTNTTYTILCTTYTGNYDYCSITTLINQTNSIQGIVNSCSVSLIATNSTWSDTKLLIGPDSDIPLSFVYPETATKIAVPASVTYCNDSSTQESGTCCTGIAYCGATKSDTFGGHEVKYNTSNLTFTNASVTGLNNASISYLSPLCTEDITNINPCTTNTTNSINTTCKICTTNVSNNVTNVSCVTVTQQGTPTSVDSTMVISVSNVNLNFDIFGDLLVYTCIVGEVDKGLTFCCPASCGGNFSNHSTVSFFGYGQSIFDLVFEVPVTLLVTSSDIITDQGIPEVCINFSGISATTFTYSTTVTYGTVTIPTFDNAISNNPNSVDSFKEETFLTSEQLASVSQVDVEVFVKDIVNNVLPPLIYTKIDQLTKLAVGFDVCKGY